MVSQIINAIKFIIFCLAVSVIVYIAYMGYIRLQQPVTGVSLFGSDQYTLEKFLNNLRDDNTPNYKEHQRLYHTLQSLNQELLGDIQKSSHVPYDYQFFFQEVIPAFLHPVLHTSNPPSDRKGPILAMFGLHSDYVAKLLFLSGPESKILKGQRRVKGYAKRLEMTGTYTSEFQHPTGLFVIEGDVINPVLQKWDGLIILEASGKLHIKDIQMLEYQFRRFDIAQSYQDYLDFLKLAEELHLSIFQSHLIVKHGEIDVSPESEKRFRRRAVFQDREHAISIYDSFDKQLTLYEFAEILSTKYHAVDAVNLDMGPYGYCALYENNKRLRLYGGKGENVQLSNIMIFNYN